VIGEKGDIANCVLLFYNILLYGIVKWYPGWLCTYVMFFLWCQPDHFM